MLYMEVVKKIGAKSSHHKENKLFIFLLFCIYIIYIYKLIIAIISWCMLLNHYFAHFKLIQCCQLYFNKTGRENFKKKSKNRYLNRSSTMKRESWNTYNSD